MEGLLRYFANKGKFGQHLLLMRTEHTVDASCPVGMWSGSRCLGYQQDLLYKCARSQGDILQLVEDLTDRLAADELELFLVQCWIIWNQRNLVMHGGVIQDPNRLHKRAGDFLKEYRQAQEHLPVQSTLSLVQNRVSWTPPTGLAYKLNVDAAMFTGISASGFEQQFAR